MKTFDKQFDSLFEIQTNLRTAAVDLFLQEFSFSTGYFATILNGCLFARSLLTFWFVNGLIDFSTAISIGAVATPAGLQIRLLAYVLLMPTFFLLRVGIHLLHPTHRNVLTRPELTDIPLLRHTLPRRDPDTVVVTSAALGTSFYLLVVTTAIGRIVLAP